MKFRKLILCISFAFIMFLSITNVNASENVKIKSVELVDKSVNTTETTEATFNGLTMNFDLKFTNVNDYAKYKVTVENKENKDYKILIDSNFDNSKYIAYDYVKTDSLKANSDTELYVTVSYKNEVSESDFSSGKYSEKNSAVLKLDDGSVSNPITSNNEVILIIGLLIITVGLFVLFKSKVNKNISFIVLFIALSIPLIVKAIDSLKITVNSNVVIEEKYSVGYEVHGYIKASDISDFDLSHADLLTTVYAGSISEENKYLFYVGAIYKEKELYAPGENVKFDSDPIPVYKFNVTKCRLSDDDVSTYGLTPVSGSVCDTPTISNASGYFSYQYAKDDLTKFDYKYNDDDNTVMKFSDALDQWNDSGKIIPNDGSTFIMPKHDVLFTLD